VDDLIPIHEIRQDRGDHRVDRPRPACAARRVDRREIGVEPQQARALGTVPVADLRPHRIAGDDDATCRARHEGARRLVGEGDRRGEAQVQPVREAELRRLLVDEDRQAQQSRRRDGGDADEACRC
jgi:hypothetical protein